MNEIIYKVINDSAERREICDKILHKLPDWFGIESAVLDYCEGVKEGYFAGVFDGCESAGFCSMLVRSENACEIYVIGILQNYHRKGIGRKLIQLCTEECRRDGKKILIVKTLSSKHSDPFYAKTREFYRAVGFIDLEELPTLWGEDNPCLNMIKLI